MKVFLTQNGDALQISSRAEGDGLLGDLFVTIKPDDVFGKLTYDDLKALGEGEHDIEP